jgi:rhamnulokinase
MNKSSHYIACDLGAESGRVILGTLHAGKIAIEEIHRFPTGAFKIGGSLRWNLPRIFEELKTGLRMVAEKDLPIDAISTDSWGVDYVLYNSRQPMLALPHHYRDSRTASTYEKALKNPGKDFIYSKTGIQFMSINTLYHLIADAEANPDLLAIADGFLNIADYINFLFSGVAKNEVSNASTTQIYNPITESWSHELIRKLSLPEQLFPEIVPSATVLGPLTDEIRSETGLTNAQVVAGCSHDTGAAVAAVPAQGEDWAYLSSGTWSLIGVELPSPLINDAALEAGFTNEAGLRGTTRFLKNIIGLWLQQESKRAWAAAGQDLSYEEIGELATKAEPLRSIINPNDARFLNPENMPEEIAGYCRETGQPVPETPGQVARCILESLALLYRGALDDLEKLTGRSISRLHVVGGGSKSALLNQFTANATGREVIAGPVEATAIGNLLIQALTLGHIESPAALRDVVRDSITIEPYHPESSAEWASALERFNALELNS